MAEVNLEMVYRILQNIQERMGNIENGQSEIKAELLTIREYQAAAHVDGVNQAEVIDNLRKRVERIERRLELSDG